MQHRFVNARINSYTTASTSCEILVKIGAVTSEYKRENLTSGSAIAEGPRDVLVSINSATTKYRYRVALFA